MAWVAHLWKLTPWNYMALSLAQFVLVQITGKCKNRSTLKHQRAPIMKRIVESLVMFGALSLIVGVIVGASAHLFFNWTPLTHHTFASYWDYISHSRTVTLTLIGLGIALFLRQVIVVLTRNTWCPANRPLSLPPYLSMPLAGYL